MRYKASFVLGVALGYALGTKAGRERYDQLQRTARTLMENPRVRQASGVVGQRGGELLNTASHKVGERVGPRLPGWVPGHRETTPQGEWARTTSATGTTSTHSDGFGTEDPYRSGG